MRNQTETEGGSAGKGGGGCAPVNVKAVMSPTLRSLPSLASPSLLAGTRPGPHVFAASTTAKPHAHDASCGGARRGEAG